MTDAEMLASLTDTEALALTAWGEARQVPRADDDSRSPVEELLAVMCVVRNRRNGWGHINPSYRAVCLQPSQFSCWNPLSGANHDAVMAQGRLVTGGLPDPEVLECLFMAGGVIAGTVIDRTDGADSYYAPDAMIPRGRVPTAAAGKILTRIGAQLFYRA
jgi:hypothetical protein